MAAPADDSSAWRAHVRFADRMAVVDKIQAALEQTDPQLARASAVNQAWQHESKCLNDAASQDDYVKLWMRRLSELQVAASSPIPHPEPARNTWLPAEPSLRIGAYTAQPFTSGIYSEVYKALPPTPISPPTTPSPESNSVSPSSSLVALKVTTPSLLRPPHDAHKEARLLESLNGTPHILPLHETFTPPDSPSDFVLVTPFLPYTLSELFTVSSPAFTRERARKVLHDVFTALAALHSRGIIHRDVKPSNILFSSPSATAPAHLADFGTAWSPAFSSATCPEPENHKVTDVGTTHYRAPELLFGYTAYGIGIDLWSTGCVAYECFHPDHEPLFDAGDVGSELRLVGSIFETLGTPTKESWPESAKLPDWGKIEFWKQDGKGWEEIMGWATAEERELVSSLVVYESGDRLTAERALEHRFFRGVET